jgi:diacylglycerol kinase family enzyme
VPRDLATAARVLAERRIAKIDVGEADGVVFFETASVGLNAAVFRQAQQIDDGDWGSGFRAAVAAFRYTPARMELRLDGGENVVTRALMVTISNAPYTGVGMTVAPDARLDDGQFDVRVFSHFSKLELLRHLTSIAFGRHRYSPHVSTHRSSRVSVVARRPLPSRADSHDLGTTPLECVVRPGSLKVVVGPGYVDGRAAPEG